MTPFREGSSSEGVTAVELLPGENPDLKAEVLQTLGEEWLHTKNILLDWYTPNQLIGTDDEYKVRDIFRSVMVAALS